MVKQGTITAPSGADANMRTLGDATPVRDTLAGVVRSALGLVSALKGVLIPFAAKKALVLNTGYAEGPIVDEINGEEAGAFVQDDPSKANSPWTWVPSGLNDAEINAAMVAIVAARKPSLTVESLTNAIEDKDSDPDFIAPARALVLHYDQADVPGGLRVVVAPIRANVVGALFENVYAEDALFVRTDVAAGAAQFGE